jgi:hypothetical protein
MHRVASCFPSGAGGSIDRADQVKSRGLRAVALWSINTYARPYMCSLHNQTSHQVKKVIKESATIMYAQGRMRCCPDGDGGQVVLY